MKTYLSLAAAAALVAGVTIANAQGTSTKQGGGPTDPPEAGGSAERTLTGKTSGSASNPSPNTMAPARTTGMGAGTDPKQGGARSDPKESGGAEERNVNGATGGSSTNPSPR